MVMEYDSLIGPIKLFYIFSFAADGSGLLLFICAKRKRESVHELAAQEVQQLKKIAELYNLPVYNSFGVMCSFKVLRSRFLKHVSSESVKDLTFWVCQFEECFATAYIKHSTNEKACLIFQALKEWPQFYLSFFLRLGIILHLQKNPSYKYAKNSIYLKKSHLDFVLVILRAELLNVICWQASKALILIRIRSYI